MINNLALPPEWWVLMQYLEEADIRNEIKTIPINVNNYNQASQKLIKEVLDDLGAVVQYPANFSFSFSLIHLFDQNKNLLFEHDYYFNRYRIITLRSSLYHNFQAVDIQKVRSFCRTKEKEAIKSGLQSGVWENQAGAKLFGPSEEPGDFGGSGSNGWKYLALCNFLIDLYCKENELFLKRITPYDSLMKEGKIYQISMPLKLQDQNFKAAIQKYICRTLGI